MSKQGLVRCGYCGVSSHSRANCRIRSRDEAEGKYYTAHPNRGQILSKHQAVKQLQPAEGASYKIFKKHSYYDKDRAQLLKDHSQQIVNQEENIGLDYNHNPHFRSGERPSKPEPHREAKMQPETANPRKLAKYKAKWTTDKNVAQTPQENQMGLANMPAEILERILSYLSFKQRISAQRTSQLIKEITITPKLWKNITIRGHLITNLVMRNILRAQTTSLNIPDCVWRANPREEIEMENHLIQYRPKLTYLGLQGFGGNNAIIATLILLAKDLTTLDLSEANFALLSHILNKIDRTNLITSINLSIMRKPLLR